MENDGAREERLENPIRLLLRLRAGIALGDVVVLVEHAGQIGHGADPESVEGIGHRPRHILRRHAGDVEETGLPGSAGGRRIRISRRHERVGAKRPHRPERRGVRLVLFDDDHPKVCQVEPRRLGTVCPVS